MQDRIEIRPLKTPADMRKCEDLQKEVWGFPDRDIVPLVELISVAKSGGCIAGAFLDLEMVGFVYGLFGLDPEGAIFHYSRMLGVKPPFRSLGLGRRLKLWQRDFVLARGIGLVRWTFDPLEGANAALNIGKLGCLADEYIVDFYGMKKDSLNAGLPTDRLFVKWFIESERVEERLAGRSIPATIAEALERPPLLTDDGGSPALIEPALAPDRACIEIPPDFQALKKADPARAQSWRLLARQAFLFAFEKGLKVVDFASGETGGRRRSAYMLSAD